MDNGEIRACKSEVRRLLRDVETLRAALVGAIEAWDRRYQAMPVDAEDDEFGPLLTARSALRMTEPMTPLVDLEPTDDH